MNLPFGGTKPTWHNVNIIHTNKQNTQMGCTRLSCSLWIEWKTLPIEYQHMVNWTFSSYFISFCFFFMRLLIDWIVLLYFYTQMLQLDSMSFFVCVSLCVVNYYRANLVWCRRRLLLFVSSSITLGRSCWRSVTLYFNLWHTRSHSIFVIQEKTRVATCPSVKKKKKESFVDQLTRVQVSTFFFFS